MLDKGADEHKGREDVRVFVNLYVLGKKRLFPGPEKHGKREKNRNGRPERSCHTFSGSGMRSIECGPKAVSTHFQASLLREQSRSERVREGLSAGLYFLLRVHNED